MNDSYETIKEKDTRIQEMEQKITKLEEFVKEGSISRNKSLKENIFQPLIFSYKRIQD